MKALVIFLFSICLSLFSSGQHKDCKSLYTGTFRVVTKDAGTTIIKRTRTEQLEINSDLGYEVIFSIKWIDNCTYELRPKKLIKGDPAIMGDGTNFLRTKIKDITDKRYVAETLSSFSDIKMDIIVEILQ